MRFARYFAIAMLLSAWALPFGFAEPVAGRDYKAISPSQPTQSGNKVEVIEFFWYGCPHCNDLNPYLSSWLKKKPKEVEFRYVPAIFRDSWIPAAKLFYALEASGNLERLNDKVYEAIHLENINPGDEKALIDWVVKQGVDRKKFEDAYRSFSVQSKVTRAQQMTKDYQISGVPAVVVDGKYLTGPGMTGGPERFTPVLDEVIDVARKEHAGGSKK
jgi:protein dithiol oxidoreductase (disulfide-forming)